MRSKKWLLLIPFGLLILYSVGPNPKSPNYNNELPSVPADASLLEKFVNEKESFHKLRPDNHARIIWANDSTKQKTDYSIVYLHGFTASQGEGEPVHRQIAKELGCNL